jgi:hypothetical protein
MRFLNWGGARDGVPDRLSRNETLAKAARKTRVCAAGWLPRVNAARNAQTQRDYHFDTGLADIARSRTTGQRAGSTLGAGLE